MSFDEIHELVKDDPKLMLNTLIRYFGGVDSLWYAVNTHITGLIDPDRFDLGQYEESIKHLISSYKKAIDDIIEQEFLVNDDTN